MFYKLTILFFFLTAYSSQSLINNYKIIFENENSTYTLKIDNNSLIFENNQPNVTIIDDSSTDTDKKLSTSSEKIYKITKESTWQEGLKVGGTDDIDPEFKVGGTNGTKSGLNTLLFSDGHQAYEIKLGFEFVTITKKSSNVKQLFPIGDNGLFIYIQEDKFNLFK